MLINSVGKETRGEEGKRRKKKKKGKKKLKMERRERRSRGKRSGFFELSHFFFFFFLIRSNVFILFQFTIILITMPRIKSRITGSRGFAGERWSQGRKRKGGRRGRKGGKRAAKIFTLWFSHLTFSPQFNAPSRFISKIRFYVNFFLFLLPSSPLSSSSSSPSSPPLLFLFFF